MTDEQKEKFKDYRKEYCKKYYAAKTLNNKNENQNQNESENENEKINIIIIKEL